MRAAPHSKAWYVLAQTLLSIYVGLVVLAVGGIYE